MAAAALRGKSAPAGPCLGLGRRGARRLLCAVVLLLAAAAMLGRLTGPARTASLLAAARSSAAAEQLPWANACAADASGQVGESNTERWGDVVSPADQQLGVADAGGCCAACAAHRDCNVWVMCATPLVCQKQCWLKHEAAPGETPPHAAGQGVQWISGVMKGKSVDVPRSALPAPDASIGAIALRTPYGTMRLRLRPEWSAESVDFVRLLAARPSLCSAACGFYRVEPGFLLQGVLRARFPPNNVTRPGPRAMRRGDVGWAGGGPGPDFFIYLGDLPAEHWKRDHTVWAEVAPQDLSVADAIAALKPRPTAPGEMHLLQENVALEVAVAEVANGAVAEGGGG